MYVQGNVVNAVDRSGMYTIPSPANWDTCAAISAYPCPQPNTNCEDCCASFLAGTSAANADAFGLNLTGCITSCVAKGGSLRRQPSDWTCTGRGSKYGCKEWLQKAYDTLANDGPTSKNAADLLDNLCRKQHLSINFVNQSPGGITLGAFGIFLSPTSTFLNVDPDPGTIALMVHELWHLPQGSDRVTTWGEIESYSLQSIVYRELNKGVPDSNLQPFEKYRGANGIVTRDICTLCEARDYLLQYSGNLPLYANEPLLITRPGEINSIPGAPPDQGGGLILPFVCKLCNSDFKPSITR